MPIKYLYIDDESIEKLKSYASAIQDDTLVIEMEQPIDFTPLMKRLDDLKEYDGLILDWRLDMISVGDSCVEFRAGALAQEIRTRGTEGRAKELPIVLLSTQEMLMSSYNGDFTSKDLFDQAYYKDIFVSNGSGVRAELMSLAMGYDKIRSQVAKGPKAILEIDEAILPLLDSRFTSRFSGDVKASVHDCARFLLKEAIFTPGVLISEELLAARLGVDREASADWSTLLEQLLPETKYNGPFCEAWPRWWSWLVEHVWWVSLEENKQSVVPLSNLTAEQRVERLKVYLELANLVPLKPIKEGYSTRFHTICAVDETPLDPIDGVLISDPDGKEPLSWQDRRYISMDAALSRRYEDARYKYKNICLHPAEVERVKTLRKATSGNA